VDRGRISAKMYPSSCLWWLRRRAGWSRRVQVTGEVLSAALLARETVACEAVAGWGWRVLVPVCFNRSRKDEMTRSRKHRTMGHPAVFGKCLPRPCGLAFWPARGCDAAMER
jgi:hypothetical protein